MSTMILGSCVVSAVLTSTDHAKDWQMMNEQAEKGGWYVMGGSKKAEAQARVPPPPSRSAFASADGVDPLPTRINIK